MEFAVKPVFVFNCVYVYVCMISMLYFFLLHNIFTQCLILSHGSYPPTVADGQPYVLTTSAFTYPYHAFM